MSITRHGDARRTSKKAALAAVALFSRCRGGELARIAKLVSEVSVGAGDVVMREGTRGDRLYVIGTGSASVTVGGRQIARLGPGGFFGEIALLDALPRTATVTAMTPMTLYEVKSVDFGRFLEESPTVLRSILGTVSARLRAAENAPDYASRH